jgi:two-component system, cell cycle sensor histidine kinase and response regulator CckA
MGRPAGNRARIASGEAAAVTTILLAEDEPALRAVMIEMLADEGYLVLEAEDGVHALEVAETHRGSIDLLVTDAGMPRLGGCELAARLMALRPETRVVLVSGGAIDAPDGPGGRPCRVLVKPFRPDALVDFIRAALA